MQLMLLRIITCKGNPSKMLWNVGLIRGLLNYDKSERTNSVIILDINCHQHKNIVYTSVLWQMSLVKAGPNAEQIGCDTET